MEMLAIDSPSRETLMSLVVGHFVAQDADPRESTADALLDELAEAMHWDALDSGEDAALADSADAIRQIFDEYCEAKTAESSTSRILSTYAHEYMACERVVLDNICSHFNLWFLKAGV